MERSTKQTSATTTAEPDRARWQVVGVGPDGG